MGVKDIAKSALVTCFASGIDSLDVDDAELITFDVFDTLVTRSCGAPESVFDLVDSIAHEERLLDSNTSFRSIRVAAENEARKAAGSNNEIRLDDIYEILPISNAGICAKLMELEYACELAVCEPNSDVVRRYDELRNTHRVAIVSDVYLPAWFVRMVLDSCGITGYEHLYVSSEFGIMKRDGQLFVHVLRDLGVEPGKALHIGDHPLADYIAPKRIAMKAFLLFSGDRRRGHSSSSASSEMNNIPASSNRLQADKNVLGCANDDDLQELQNTILNILQLIVTICEEEDIPYYLVEGSCLGAVRHSGIIPWDDDIDIAIPASFHSRFSNTINERFKGRLYAVDAFSSGGEELCRVFDTTVSIEGGLYEAGHLSNPVVDVLLICGLPRKALPRHIHYSRIWLRHKLYKFSDPSIIVNRDRVFVERLAIAVACRASRFSLLDRDRELAKVGRLMCKYDYNNDEFAFCLSWYGRNEIVPASYYGNGRSADFNGLSACIPSEAEKYLTQLYGDYLKLPPESERYPKHHYKIVKNTQESKEAAKAVLESSVGGEGRP